MRRMLALAGMLLPALAQAQSRAEHIGGTAPQIAVGTEGSMLRWTTTVTSPSNPKKSHVRVSYDQINLVEYGQQVSRRLALAVVISPMFLLSKQREHFLTVGYMDDDGKQRALVFRVDKNDIRSTLVSLEARPRLTKDSVSGRGRAIGKGWKAAMALLFAATVGARVAPPPRLVSSLPGPEDLSQQLLTIKRIYVDRLTGGETAAQMRDLIISSLQGWKLFVLTENADRADAVLRGAAEDLIYTDDFQSSDSVDIRGGSSSRDGSSTGSRGSRNSYYENSTNGHFVSLGAGEHESTNIKERKHEALATVRR